MAEKQEQHKETKSMKEVKEYKTIEWTDYGSRDSMVNTALQNGWELYGNPFTYTDDDGFTSFGQVVVR